MTDIALVAPLTIILFLINLRCLGERVGRAAERFDQLESHNAIHSHMLLAASRRPRSQNDLVGRLRGGGF